MTREVYAYSADAVLVLHVALVVFVIVGQILILHGWRAGWLWTRAWSFRLSHLLVVACVTLGTWFNVICPLTLLENWLRLRAGQAAYDDVGCIAHWLQKFLFYTAPGWVFDVLYTVFALLVVASFALYPPRCNAGWKRRSNRAE